MKGNHSYCKELTYVDAEIDILCWLMFLNGFVKISLFSFQITKGI